MTLNYGQIRNTYKSNSGVTDETHLDIMVAIAIAESSGNPEAVNDSSGAIGLWQIMWSVWSKDPDVVKATRGRRGSLIDPNVNAAVARHVYKKQGYSAWTTYNNGSYKQHLRNGNTNVSDKLGLPDKEQVADTLVSSPLSMLGKIQDFILDSGKAVGVGLLGLVLVILGVVILVVSSKPVVNAVGAASKRVLP